jgi:hypothetical protein
MCTSKALYCASLFVSFCLSAAPVRRRIHATLSTRASSRSTAGEEVQKASVLASMIGNRSAGVAYKLGLKNFVGLPMSALTLGDFKTNQDTGLYQKTLHCDMGGVDAFISHSWRDEAELKWEKLEAWKAELGKPDPLVWLDKACINQQKIDESLASLPVFLAGCENLVVLAGKTYTQRLWCVMELFTFVEMGGEEEHIQLFVLGTGDEKHKSRLSTASVSTNLFENFSAKAADCFKPEEKSHLLGIIETSYARDRCTLQLPCNPPPTLHPHRHLRTPLPLHHSSLSQVRRRGPLRQDGAWALCCQDGSAQSCRPSRGAHEPDRLAPKLSSHG